jgi:hypothetical protein
MRVAIISRLAFRVLRISTCVSASTSDSSPAGFSLINQPPWPSPLRLPISSIDKQAPRPTNGRSYDFFEIASDAIGEPEQAEIVELDSTVELPSGALAMFRLINPKKKRRYECRWKWANEAEGPE